MKPKISAIVLLALAEASLTSAFVPAACRSAYATGASPTPLRVPSASSSVVTFMADDETNSEETVSAEEAAPKPTVKCPDCDLCDGSGRILGGIGVVLPWWPIKAYRPCPNFIDRGGRYVRSGQALDEIAFGRDSSYNPTES